MSTSTSFMIIIGRQVSGTLVKKMFGSPVLGNHNTGIKNYSSIVIFLQKKYNTGIKSYSSIVNNTVRK